MGSPSIWGQPSPNCNSFVVLLLIGQILSLPPVELSGNFPLPVRLVNGYSDCSGHIEIYNSSLWYAVCDDSWDINDAEVVCSQLGCGKAKEATVSAYFGRVAGPITLKEFHCSGTESFLSSCSVMPLSQPTCDTSEKAGVICEGNYPLSVRLTNGSSSCTGRVEIYFNSQWGTICDDSWDFKDAEVVCRHVGCGRAQSFKSGAYFGEGTGPITMADIRCRGDEQYLSDCIASPPFPHHNCGHEKDAGVICKDVNECITVEICGNFSVCINTEGSYTCKCQQGFHSKSGKDNFTDVATSRCVDIDECNTTGICGNFSVCINTEGSYMCKCQQGFQSKSGKDNFTDVATSGCVDVDECNTTGICGNFSVCINTEGNYTCKCQQGFQSKSGKDNFTDVASSGCVDVDECNTTGICGNFSVCINTEGSYTCTCQQGFQSKSGKDTFTDVATSGCVDVDECNTTGICGHFSVCINTEGNYTCKCHQGFQSKSRKDNFTAVATSGCVELVILMCTSKKEECLYRFYLM